MASHPDTLAHLRLRPRSAAVAIAADPTLQAPYRLVPDGPAPSVRRHGDTIEIAYNLAARLRALGQRPRPVLQVLLNPAHTWEIEVEGGVSGLRADLRELQVSDLTIAGGARDVVVEAAQPRGELAVRVEGGLSGATIRRPAAVPVSVHIDGGASNLQLDDGWSGSIGGIVRRRTSGDPNALGEVALRVLGGASELRVDARDLL